MRYPLFVAFYWHMHQPYYRNPVTGEYALPWVRLHATKDYLHMAEVLADFPKIHATFNLVPSLVEQLLDYAQGQAADYWLEVALKPQWSDEDKRFMLAHFFSISWDKVIRRYPAYWRLLQMGQAADGQVHLLSESYWRDLAAWFNLAWIDPSGMRRNGALRRLAEKGGQFTREDLLAIAAEQQRIIARVLPTYQQLQAAGQIEITTSPYYHPILPLLVDSESAYEASSHLTLPPTRFRCPEDAAEQLRRAQELHARIFGTPPKGLWPSEGAVSQEAVEFLATRGGSFRWLASDEGILAQSLGLALERDERGCLLNPRLLYQPYGVAGGHLAMVFRDRVLSDFIGFVYKHWDSRSAAEDLVGRLRRIHDQLADDEAPYLVPIIMDGENCWEEYENNGDDFLRHLYDLLAQETSLRAVTVSEYLAEYPLRVSLRRLFAGSWINHNLETWIGEAEQNRAWDYLADARQRLIAWERDYPLADFDTLERAWREIYIAEGSDWFWWYYSHNKGGHTQLFDVGFRTHLANVYTIIGHPAPAWLKEPIVGAAERVYYRPATAHIAPRLSLSERATLDWTGAGYAEPAAAGAAPRPGAILRRLYFGYNPADLYLRLEADEDLTGYEVDIYIAAPGAERASDQPRYAGTNPQIPMPAIPLTHAVCLAAGQATLCQAGGPGLWERVRFIETAAVGRRTAEVCLALAELGLRLGDQVALLVLLAKDGFLAEALPDTGHIGFTLAERA